MPLQNDGLRLLRHLSDLRFEEELRGYSKSQVDRVLQKLSPMAEEIETLQGRLSEAETRAASAEARLMERPEQGEVPPVPPGPAPSPAPAAARIVSDEMPETPADFDETLRKTLVMAQRTADETVKEAYDEAERVTNNAHGEADLVLSKARTEADQIEKRAEERQHELVSGAEAERDRLLEEAQAEATAKKIELEAALNEAEGSERAELVEQIANLQEIRNLLSSDIEAMEGHLADRRSVIQTALAELSRAIDDPASMDPVAAPVLSDIDPIDEDDYAPVSVAVDGLHDGGSNEDGLHEHGLSENGDSGIAVGLADDGQGESSDEASDLEQDAGNLDAGSLDSDGLNLDGANSYDAAPDEANGEATNGKPTDDPFYIGDTDHIVSEDGPDDLSVAGSVENRLADTGVGPAPDAGGPPTQEFSFDDVPDLDPDAKAAIGETLVDADLTDNGLVSTTASDPWAVEANVAGEAVPSRPAWVEAVPEDNARPKSTSQDPFLEELRRATSEDSVDSDEALDRFLDGDAEEERKNWFGRRGK